MRSFITGLLILFTLPSAGQSDPQAVKVLDSFSAKASGAPAVSIKFNLVTVDQIEQTTDTLKGSVIISGNRYRLDLPENIIFFNGQSSWSYLPDVKEVTITSPGKDDDSFMSRPSAIFTAYKTGYKNRLIEETSNNYIVDLYPEDVKSELIRIRLTIGKSLLDLKTLEYKRRDGITATLHVQEYDLKKKPAADTFTFQKDKHKDVEVIDMR